MVGGALAGATQPAMHDRTNPASAGANLYRSGDGTWFVLVVQANKVGNLMKAIGRSDLLTDPRFSDPAKAGENRPQLVAILDEIFASQPMAHWAEIFASVEVTYGVVNGPEDVAKDPQLELNGIAVPLADAGTLTRTISSPFKLHGVDKVPARRGPRLGEHNDEILHELGFDDSSIAALREAGALPESVKAAA
jgi:formyl-CoA transferase